ncbi:hypothetical protein [Mariprofundus erugo]|uniref:hypothetical protein n=1 Tax=Mariprofundus erugo TaxID=2528639 RepID=UPI001386F2C7|nr:hypothetical protein [Mariprofundus erugo]
MNIHSHLKINQAESLQIHPAIATAVILITYQTSPPRSLRAMISLITHRHSA